MAIKRGHRVRAMLKHVADGEQSSRHMGQSVYVAPQNYVRISVAQLIAGSPRQAQNEGQFDLLNSFIKAPAGSDVSVFAAGDTSLLRNRAISIIGTRQVTADGAARARRLARDLADRGIVVTSGLAEGVDTNALEAAIEVGGKVAAVIGTPLDQAYPAKNSRLQEEIYRDHLLVSQFPIGARVYPANFPARNRTMAFLTDASVVIEASDSSGTLHQAAECVRLKRWLCIARNVVENPRLEWPKKFLGYSKCVVLTSTDELLEKIYGAP